MREDLDQLGTQALELILLDQLVEIAREALEHEAEMALVRKRIVHPKYVMFVPRVVGGVELHHKLASD
jgi:hypothetical protein